MTFRRRMAETPPDNTRYAAVLEREQGRRRWIYRLYPDYRYSNQIYEDLIVQKLTPEVLWLDLGCGDNSLAFEFGDRCTEVLSMDRMIHPLLRRDDLHKVVLGDAAELPLRSESVDLVTGNMVLEHLIEPNAAFGEIARILKPGGMTILRTPNRAHPLLWMVRVIPDGMKKRLLKALLGIREWDVFPTFYRANRPQTLRRLCREAGFARFEILAVEDVHAAFFLPMLFSLLYYALVRIRGLSSWRSNLIVIAHKE